MEYNSQYYYSLVNLQEKHILQHWRLFLQGKVILRNDCD